MFVSARHIFVVQDRRQTAECPDTDGDKRILKRQGLIETQRHDFFQELALCLPANAGADASERGSRRKRIWGQRRTRLGADTSASAPRFADGHREPGKRHGSEHVANMTNALGHDFVGFSARAWPPQYSPPHFASEVSYSASPQGFVAPYYLTKRQIS